MPDKYLDSSVHSGKFMDSSTHSGTALFRGEAAAGSDLEKETSREFQLGAGSTGAGGKGVGPPPPLPAVAELGHRTPQHRYAGLLAVPCGNFWLPALIPAAPSRACLRKQGAQAKRPLLPTCRCADVLSLFSLSFAAGQGLLPHRHRQRCGRLRGWPANGRQPCPSLPQPACQELVQASSCRAPPDPRPRALLLLQAPGWPLVTTWPPPSPHLLLVGAICSLWSPVLPPAVVANHPIAATVHGQPHNNRLPVPVLPPCRCLPAFCLCGPGLGPRHHCADHGHCW